MSTRELVERELPADRRCDRQRLVAGPESRSSRLPIASRTPSGMRALQRSTCRRPRRQRPLLRQEPDDLADEERVSLGLGVEGPDESRSGANAHVASTKRATSS